MPKTRNLTLSPLHVKLTRSGDEENSRPSAFSILSARRSKFDRGGDHFARAKRYFARTGEHYRLDERPKLCLCPIGFCLRLRLHRNLVPAPGIISICI